MSEADGNGSQTPRRRERARISAGWLQWARTIAGDRPALQPATVYVLGSAMAAGEEAVVPNAMEAVWQGLQQEAADGLVGV